MWWVESDEWMRGCVGAWVSGGQESVCVCVEREDKTGWDGWDGMGWE